MWGQVSDVSMRPGKAAAGVSKNPAVPRTARPGQRPGPTSMSKYLTMLVWGQVPDLSMRPGKAAEEIGHAAMRPQLIGKGTASDVPKEALIQLRRR